MQINSAKFVKGIVESDDLLNCNFPQIAFIGRSNVGKSSLINSLTQQKDLAITSSFPGRTRQINLFLINNSSYFLDLPGYGFARSSVAVREQLFDLIDWYLFDSDYVQKKVVLIIDANIGPTKDDLAMLKALDGVKKDVIIVANKIDKIKRSKYETQFQAIKDQVGDHKIIPYSSHDKIGRNALTQELLG